MMQRMRRPPEFASLVLGGCRNEEEECHEIFDGQLMPARSEGPVSGNQKASARTFFTLNGIRPEADGEAITDTDTAVKALSVAGELPVNPASWSKCQGFFDSS